MSKSQQSFNKREREKKKKKRRQEKLERREQRKLEKEQSGKKTFEEQLSYVDEFGNITSTPPDPKRKSIIKASDIELGGAKRSHSRPGADRRGRVNMFNDEKGFGFIRDAESGESFFFHINDAYSSIKQDDKVSFETIRGPKGMNAVNIKQS